MKKREKVIAKKLRATKALIKILAVIGIISILIGIISIYCQRSMLRIYMNQPDKKDYYGEYYAYTGTDIIIIELEKDNTCVLTVKDSPIKEVKTFKYRYLSPSESLSILPSIEIYTSEQETEMTVCTLKILTKNPYRFLLLEASAFFTKKELVFEEIMKDPKDYYGDYASNNKSISIRKNGDLYFRQYKNNELYSTITYVHEYRNKNWVRIKYPENKKCKGALLIESRDSNLCKVVYIIDENTLYFEGETYYKE